MTTRIKLRRDTYQNWYDHNPTLALGEPAYDTTNNQVKVGDGTTAWRALDPLTAALGDLVVAGSTITSPEGVHQDLVLSTVDTGPTTHDWTFGIDGTLTLPAGGDILDSEGNRILDKITNTDGIDTYSVSVGTNGVITMTTARGGLEFGALPEPGGPTHFHIMRPAGENGSGGTDLYFGDDFNYVLQRPASYNGSPAYGVEIGANDFIGDQQVWRFETDGKLTIPGSIKSESISQVGQRITCMDVYGSPLPRQLFNSTTFTGGVYSDIQVGWTVSNGDGWTATVTGVDDPFPWYITIDDSWDHVNFNKLVSFTSPDYVAATAEDLILTSDASSLTLSANGSLTLPNSGGVIKSTDSSTIINGAYKSFTFATGAFGPGPGYAGNGVGLNITPESEQIKVGWTCTFSNSATIFTVTVVSYISNTISINFDNYTDSVVFPMVANSPPSSIKLQPVNDGNTWTFSNDGALTFPNTSTFDGNDFVAKENEELNLTIVDSSAYIGVKENNNNINDPAAYMDVYFGKKSRIRTASLDNQTEYDWIFNPNGSLTLPQYDTAISQNDGETTFDGGSDDIGVQVNVDKTIYLRVGDNNWVFGAGAGGANILQLPAGGEITSAAGTGDVVVEANNGTARTWTFGGDGALTFPDTSVQTTAYKRTTGSWDVHTGSDTYSFTVPQSGTYTMWVRGTCDNGIITWNATATVTNNNVPVVGQQYAWVYTGGGTPIDFTNIPAQFVGTANNIVRSDPAVTGPTNQFNFVINNTSGLAQTVYWGYVAQ